MIYIFFRIISPTMPGALFVLGLTHHRCALLAALALDCTQDALAQTKAHWRRLDQLVSGDVLDGSLQGEFGHGSECGALVIA